MSGKCQVLAQSVRGARHVRSEQPNQDAFRVSPAYRNPVIACLADGHGAALYTRSETGAQLAVNITYEILECFAEAHHHQPLHVVKSLAEEWLPRKIVQSWQNAVRQHLADSPLPEGQIAAKNPYLPYGSTLLAVLITERYRLFLQLGDGDILMFDGNQPYCPITPDLRLVANQTTSLCTLYSFMTDPHAVSAWRDMQILFQPHAQSEPFEGILLATDGLDNSFETTEHFHQNSHKLLKTAQDSKPELFSQELKNWLELISLQGSQDDITLALIYPAPLPERPLTSSNPIRLQVANHHAKADFQSIQAAIDAVQIGQIIEVAPGIYTEALRIDKPVKIRGLPTEKERVELRLPPHLASEQAMVEIYSSHVVIEQLDILATATSQQIQGVSIHEGCQAVCLDRCRILGFYYNVQVLTQGPVYLDCRWITQPLKADLFLFPDANCMIYRPSIRFQRQLEYRTVPPSKIQKRAFYNAKALCQHRVRS